MKDIDLSRNRLLVNIGCGSVFNHEWLNFDKFPQSENVARCDISGISRHFSVNSVDMFYLSHVVEHLPRELLTMSVDTLYQLLKPEGVIRIVVPDLEKLASDYLHTIEALSAGKDVAFQHEWIVAEMFDQCTRLESGGRMKNILSNIGPDEREYVARRAGTSVANAYAIVAKPTQDTGLIEKARSLFQLKSILSHSKSRLNRLASRLMAKRTDGILNGEKHMWMYDFYQLERELTQAGFKSPIKQNFNTSMLPNFHRFSLDQDVDGLERKPDSVYVEAIKPATI